jgi:hypothetical protein
VRSWGQPDSANGQDRNAAYKSLQTASARLPYQFQSVSDPNFATVDHMTIQGQLSPELLNGAPQDIVVLVEHIGVESGNHKTATKVSYSDQDISNPKHVTRPISFSQF